jgi:hypothetical protein
VRREEVLPADVVERLLANGRATQGCQQQGGDEPDHEPVAKLFMPVGAATWLLTEIDPQDPDQAFGLCDLGMGYPELGWVSLAEILSVKKMGLGVERDLHWTAKGHRLSQFASRAREAGRIVDHLEP